MSVLAHAAAGVGLFASGVWGLDRLDHDHRTSIGLGVMLPPGPPPEGGHGATAAAPPKLVPKKKREIVKLAQLTIKEDREAKPDLTRDLGDDGEGQGDGDAPGRGRGDGPPGGCLGDDCGGFGTAPPPVCGNGTIELGESCDDGNRTAGDGCSAMCTSEPKPQAETIVPPDVVAGLRLPGETQIHPPAPVKTEMLRDGRDRVIGTLKICIDRAGAISRATLLRSTRYPAYDALLLSKVRDWRYRPYEVNGRAVPACSTVTFVYSMR